jgi:NADH dehydrogenase [ubiquinone] 1 alpha subcomplex assembly factor 7
VSETPLAARLKRLIEANGPMSIAQYMAHCLGDPEHGYYMTRDPLGADGDFTTAPEVSQMFGEIVAAWLIDAWRRAGSPSPVRLVELGPGRGTLMADILRVAARVPSFSAAIAVHLVETSPVLRRKQAETLSPSSHAPLWHAALSNVPDGPLLLVANEFFDAPCGASARSASPKRASSSSASGRDASMTARRRPKA